MGRRKRPYVPKVKGCYECSQRRINCDQAEPSCKKCVSKGLECSGLGAQYRFHNHFVLRTGGYGFKHVESKKFVDHGTRIQDSLVLGGTVGKDIVEDCKSDENNDNDNDDDDAGGLGLSYKFHASGFSKELLDPAVIEIPVVSNLSIRESCSPSHISNLLCPTVSTTQATNSTMIYEIPPTTLVSWEQYFLTYFSDRIASEMVLIDDHYNGWRSLILPIAHSSELVREAVMTAAASHFTVHVSDQHFDSKRIYAKVIHHLYQRQNLRATNRFGRQIILLTLLVLLTTMMVNGSSDFPAISRLLESALEVSGGEEAFMNDELGLFLVRQIRKLRGYAAPFLSETFGLERLSLTAFSGQEATNGWDDFRLYCSLYPEISSSASIVYELNRQACKIYVRRASALTSHERPMNDLVEEFKQTLDMAPVGYPGRHTIVWATFLAAAESTLPNHRQYFIDALLTHYHRNGFANILTAIESLKEIWATKLGSKSWTKLLPELGVFIV